jgi:hypothetical protein
VSALATRGGALHVVLVSGDAPGAAPSRVRLHVPRGFGRARLLALTAPSSAASAGVRLGGRTVLASGAWHEPRRLPLLANRRGVITLSLAPASAALVTVAPPRRTHR